jgi:hypothetical protein
LPYLVGIERPELIACIEQPVAEPNARQEQQAEPVEAAMWAAMDGLARFSQASVIHQIGVFVRLEAIRTEKHQTRFQPLQPYMDQKSIGVHIRPWQQIVMFFARTQREHAWKSPRYQFTRRQREGWQALVEEAKRIAEDEEEIEEEELEEEESEEDEGGSSNEEDTDTVEAEREEARRVFEQQQQARRGPRQTLIQQRQQEFADVEWLRRQLAWWTKRCGICEVAGEGQSGHDVRRCWRPESRQTKEMIKAVEEKMRFEEYSGCFWCGVPQEVGNRWEDNGRGRYQRAKGRDCQYQGVSVGGLVGLLYRGKEGVIER